MSSERNVAERQHTFDILAGNDIDERDSRTRWYEIPSLGEQSRLTGTKSDDQELIEVIKEKAIPLGILQNSLGATNMPGTQKSSQTGLGAQIPDARSKSSLTSLSLAPSGSILTHTDAKCSCISLEDHGLVHAFGTYSFPILPETDYTHDVTNDNGSLSSSNVSISELITEGTSQMFAAVITGSAQILNDTYRKSIQGFRQHGSGQSDRCHQRNTSERRPQEILQNTALAGKRKYQPEKDDDDDAGNTRRPEPLVSYQTRCDDLRPMACPFNKFDSYLFGPDSPDESYHICGTCNFITLAHLKYVTKCFSLLPF